MPQFLNSNNASTGAGIGSGKAKVGQRRVETGRTLQQLEQEEFYGRRATGGISSKLGSSLFMSKGNVPSSVAGQQARKRYAARTGASRS